MFWIAGGGAVVMEFCKLFSNPLPEWLDRHFEHVPWQGFVAWDLIMPLFLFIVGVAMPFSIGKRLARGDSKAQIYRKVISRTVLLFILGMIAQGHLLDFKLDTFHIYSNTLQAIAAGYLIGSIALLQLSVRGQAALTGALLVIFWACMKFVPVPGVGAGVLTPDGNLAMWIDKALLGRFQDQTTYTWILSSLVFGATTLIGILAGHLLGSRRSGQRKTVLLAVSGLACLAAGWLWNLEFPVIKHIWTSSMVLVAGGWSLLLLALFYWVIDVQGYRRWAFFLRVIGMNAIVAYMAGDFINFGFTSKALFGGLAAHLGIFGPLLIAAGSLGVLWGGLYYLYRNRIFLRV
jgi:predicted acyltransferase